MKRNMGLRLAGLTQSCGAVQEEILSVAAVSDRRGATLRERRYSSLQKASRQVDRLPKAPNK
jgi:hypothetical protein